MAVLIFDHSIRNGKLYYRWNKQFYPAPTIISTIFQIKCIKYHFLLLCWTIFVQNSHYLLPFSQSQRWLMLWTHIVSFLTELNTTKKKAILKFIEYFGWNTFFATKLSNSLISYFHIKKWHQGLFLGKKCRFASRMVGSVELAPYPRWFHKYWSSISNQTD